jgi:hypothetical protein
MLRKLLILLAITPEMLVLSTLHAGIDIIGATIFGTIVTFNYEEVLVVGDDMAVDIGKAAMTEREVIDGIQHIGLALTIATDKAVDLR